MIAHAGGAHLACHRSEIRKAIRWAGGMQAAPWVGMRNHLHQPLEHALDVITLARPLVEAVARRDRDLGAQLRRALSSIALNIAEASGNQGGNARLRYESARGSLYERAPRCGSPSRGATRPTKSCGAFSKASMR